MRVAMTRCDLCGFEIGPFTQVDFLDFCSFCADDRVIDWCESGGCRVTFDHERQTWRCSCGARHPLQITLPSYVVRRVPNILIATANMHVNGMLPA